MLLNVITKICQAPQTLERLQINNETYIVRVTRTAKSQLIAFLFSNAFNDVGAAGEADRVEQMRIGSRIKL